MVRFFKPTTRQSFESRVFSERRARSGGVSDFGVEEQAKPLATPRESRIPFKGPLPSQRSARRCLHTPVAQQGAQAGGFVHAQASKDVARHHSLSTVGTRFSPADLLKAKTFPAARSVRTGLWQHQQDHVITPSDVSDWLHSQGRWRASKTQSRGTAGGSTSVLREEAWHSVRWQEAF